MGYLNRQPQKKETNTKEIIKDITHNSVDAESQNSVPVAKQKKTPKAKAVLDYSSWPSLPSKQVMSDWLALRKQKRSPITQTVVNQFGKQFVEAAKHGLSVEDCLTECVTRGWAGFKCEWLLNSRSTTPKHNLSIQAYSADSTNDYSDYANDFATGEEFFNA